MSRVVAAVSRDAQDRIRAILPDFDLRFVDTATQLVCALDEASCDLVAAPFNRLGRTALKASRIALCELGARSFIDLLEYPDDALGNARVRAMLERLISR